MSRGASESAGLIGGTLARAGEPDAYDTHEFVSAVLEMSGTYDDKNLADVLLWCYEHNPCTNCRLDIIEMLLRFGKLSCEIIEECQHDASEDVRNFALEQGPSYLQD